MVSFLSLEKMLKLAAAKNINTHLAFQCILFDHQLFQMINIVVSEVQNFTS